MCRIAAYFGPTMPLDRLLGEPPHGLTDQSRHAREMRGSPVAGDGWGVGWFGPEPARTPGLIKGILPLWADLNAQTAPRAIVARSIVGHIRHASESSEVCFTNIPLYALDDSLWTVNGELQPWPGPLAMAIRQRLDPDHEAAIQGSTDAEVLGALWRTCRRAVPGGDPARGLRQALATARDLALAHGGQLSTNVIVSHAGGFLAVRYAEPDEPNSLYRLAGEPRWHGAALVASEPLDDGPGWRPVPPSTLVIADDRGLRCEPLALPEPATARF